MADKKISELTLSATPLSGTEVVPVVQSGLTKQVSIANLTSGRAVSVGSLNSTGNVVASNLGITNSNWIGWGNFNSRFTGTGGGSINVVTNSLTAATFDTSQNLSLSSGNLVIGTSGKGIDFSADGNAAGMTSELLDDYEEGTFTPTFTPETGSFTSITVAATGRYTKIGNMVYFTITVRTTAATTIGTASGRLLITGLPFTVSSVGGYGAISIMQMFNLGTAFTYVGAVPEPSQSRIYLTKNSSNSSVGYVQATELNTAAGGFNNLIGIFGQYTV